MNLFVIGIFMIALSLTYFSSFVVITKAKLEIKYTLDPPGVNCQEQELTMIDH